ncbi:hypothetical protein BY458DRAFT_440526, partial [Sporodiniella umbellata]
VLAYLVRSYTTSNKPVCQEAKHPEVLVFRNYTPVDLLPYDGHKGRRDASRGLAKNSFDEEMLTDPKEPIDKLEDLTEGEWDSLREWEQHFASKYLFVGKFTLLPDELQIKILSQLSTQDLLKASTVCKKWVQLVFDGSLWSDLNVAPFYKTIPKDYLLKLIRVAAGFLKSANFRGSIQFNGQALRTLSDHCPNVQVMIIKDCRNLSAASITCFLQKAKNLRILDVSGLDTIKNSTLTTVLLSKLEKLNLSWCRNISGQGLIPLISSCVHLRYLKLNGCPQLDDTTMETLGHHLPSLAYLSLSACASLTDTAMLSFLSASKTQSLCHLNLSSCARLTDTTLRYLAQYAPHLTHLELAGCVPMTDQGFCYFSSRIKTLQLLDLEDLQQITGITVRSIANHQTRLERLCLSNCTQVADDAIRHLILHGVCHKLYHLELDNCMVTDDALDIIATYLQQQKEPDVSADSAISLYPPRPRHINLEVLDCSNITELGVREALRKASPLLTIKSFYSFQEHTLADAELWRRQTQQRTTRSHPPQSDPSSQTRSQNCIIL